MGFKTYNHSEFQLIWEWWQWWSTQHSLKRPDRCLTIRRSCHVHNRWNRESYSSAEVQSAYSTAPANSGEIYMCAYMTEYIYIYIYIYICVCVCVWLYERIYMYIWLYESIYIWVWTYERTYIYIYIYICVCVCVAI